MSGVAPVVRLTAAFATGVGLGLLGAPIWIAPLLFAAGLMAPKGAFAQPTGWAAGNLSAAGPRFAASWIATAVAAGLAAGSLESSVGACEPVSLGPFEGTGHFDAAPRGGSAPFRVDGRCGYLTAVVSETDRLAPAGRLLRLSGHVIDGRHRPWLRVSTVQELRGAGTGRETVRLTVARSIVRWRDGLVARAYAVHGEQGGMVAALVFARREGLDPQLRDAFAAAGIAHLLAISGFHVGVIWGLALSILRWIGLPRRRSATAALALVWAYVVLIGAPDAAARAALILTAMAAGRVIERPLSRWGPLASAALILLVTDPGRLASAGFQLSFAGAAGLTAWAGAWRDGLADAVERSLGHTLPSAGTGALIAGAAATLATLPVVAWHFERVSLVGIPVTLVATPLVTLALPAAIGAVGLSFVAPPVAAFLGGGTITLLQALSRISTWVDGLPWATAWVSRPVVVATLVGCLCALKLARAPGVGRRGRRVLTVSCALCAVLVLPVWYQVRSLGSLELRMIDVGQGDALLIRSPRGRAMLIDAGRPPDGDLRGHPVVRELHGLGIRRLEWLMLTHADADHFGGAEAILESFDVGAVVDPALPVGKPLYQALLDRAAGLGVPWQRARVGDSYDLDGVLIDVMFPSIASAERVVSTGTSVDANEASLVLQLRWGDFRAVFTGDAYVDAERSIAGLVGDVDLLKVGHHGSRTSTDTDFLARTRPEWALISVGRYNGYGHPAPEVVRRLEDAGAKIRRTDRDGTVRVLVRRSGQFEVVSER